MNLSTQIMLTAIAGAALVLGVGYFRNTVINIITAPLLGIIVAIVPSGLTDELWLSRLMWLVASVAVFAMLHYVKDAPALDFSRALSGVNRRRAARKAVASEVKGWRFEVENA